MYPFMNNGVIHSVLYKKFYTVLYIYFLERTGLFKFLYFILIYFFQKVAFTFTVNVLKFQTFFSSFLK